MSNDASGKTSRVQIDRDLWCSFCAGFCNEEDGIVGARGCHATERHGERRIEGGHLRLKAMYFSERRIATSDRRRA